MGGSKLFLVFLLSIVLGVAFAYPKEIIIKDVLGRQVQVELPAKRIIVGFYYTDFLAVGTQKAFDHVVGFVKAAWADYMPPSYEVYSSVIPKLKTLSDIGDPQFGTFSAEKVLALKPDLMILADWQYNMISNDLPLLERAGIPIVVISYNQETLKQHLLSTEILGTLLGTQERAKDINNFYQERLQKLQERIARANLPKPKVYIEFGNKGPQELSFTYGKDMWGAIVALAGGDNIALPFVEKWAPINAEQVIASKPNVIIITGRETELEKNKEAMVMGIGIEESEALRRLLGFKTRKGWQDLPAIREEKLFAIYHRASTTMADIASVEFMAQVFYPSLFRDIDPKKTYWDFHKKFMPLVPEGTYMINQIAK